MTSTTPDMLSRCRRLTDQRVDCTDGSPTTVKRQYQGYLSFPDVGPRSRVSSKKRGRCSSFSSSGPFLFYQEEGMAGG